jgi:hypothetical protein
MDADGGNKRRFVTYPGMGHDLPRGAWDQIVDAIVRNSRRAPARR